MINIYILYGFALITLIFCIYLFTKVKYLLNEKENTENYATKSDYYDTVNLINNDIDSINQKIDNIQNNVNDEISSLAITNNGDVFKAATIPELGYEIDLNHNIQFNQPINFKDNVRFNGEEVRFNGEEVHFNHHHRWINTLPKGSIIAWYKKYDTSGVYGSDIPRGWAPCDGNWYKPSVHGFVNHAEQEDIDDGTAIKTPDLRGRFILGAGQGTGLTNREVGDNPDGEENVTLNPHQMPRHTHALKYDIYRASWDGSPDPQGTGHTDIGEYHGVSWGKRQKETLWEAGNNQPHNNMPPYNVLTYIIKL
jgi:microcystin-dependent protein